MKRVSIIIDRVACSRNMLLYRRLVTYFKKNGMLVDSGENIEGCDIVLLCSCGFTLEELRKNLEIVRKLHTRLDPLPATRRPMIIVTGCLPGICPDRLAEIHAGPALGINDLNMLDTIIQATVPLEQIPQQPAMASRPESGMTLGVERPAGSRTYLRAVDELLTSLKTKMTERFGPHLFINDPDSLLFNHYRDRTGSRTWCVLTGTGCLGNCSYCAIRFAKGRLRSRPRQEIIEDVLNGIKNNYRLISLIADDNGSYGRDIGTTFVDLIKELSCLEGDFQLMIDSLNPRHFIELVQWLRDSGEGTPSKIKSIQLGMQHVSERVLREMNRPGDALQLQESLIWLATNRPEIQVLFLLIIGWPGETRQEFREVTTYLRQLLRMNPFYSFTAFAYSPIPGTVAATLPGRLRPRTLARRHRTMRRIQLRHEFLNYLRMAMMQKNPLKALAINAGFRTLHALSNLAHLLEWKLIRPTA